MESKQSDNLGKVDTVCDICHCGMSRHAGSTLSRRRRRSVLTRHLPLIMSILAFILSSTTLAYVLLNTGCSPCRVSVSDLPDSIRAEASLDRFQKEPVIEEEENVIPKDIENNGTDIPIGFHLDKRDANSESGKNGKGGKSKCKNKRGRGSCKTRSRGHRVTSAHFVPKGVKQGFPASEDCLEFESKTKICKNDTAIQIGQNEDVMSDFWTLSTPKSKKKSSVELVAGKSVKVLKAGVYLIYGQALFLDSKYRTSFQVLIDGVSVMRCTESSNEQVYDVSYQSCGVSGVFSLKQNQHVAIKFPYPKTQINLKNDTTYFGLVHLSK